MAIAVEIAGFIVINGRFVVGGVLKLLKILMFVTNGESDTSKDNKRTRYSC